MLSRGSDLGYGNYGERLYVEGLMHLQLKERLVRPNLTSSVHGHDELCCGKCLTCKWMCVVWGC